MQMRAGQPVETTSVLAGTRVGTRLAVVDAMPTNTPLAFLFSTLVFTLSSGCVVQTGGPQHAQPATVVAKVDAGVTLTSAPGQGAGVNVEYQTGGHWHIWWTCDTNISGLNCNFYVDVIARTGNITNVAGDRLESTDQLTTPSATEVTLNTGTSTGVDGVFFDTDPGATIDVLQQIGTVQDGSYFYWSQGGRVMGGGVPGNVADPMGFVGSAP
jgi:hypothetical protein